jgi:tagaturonate reductase
MVEPFQHPNVTYTDDLTPYLRLKLHILNLGHTWLAETWRSTGRPQDETVRAILADPAMLAGLHSLYRDEIIPGFAACGLGDQAARYVAQTVDRFRNPYLDHRISDIAQNHALKIERRATAFLAWVHGHDPAVALARLTQLATRA